MTPVVSVIIPAFRARATLPAALASVAASGLSAADMEVIIAPDDGDGYDGLPDHGLRLVRCAHHHTATGAGPARNRAIARARGELVAFLDADDTWQAGYLAALVPLARCAGAAFGRTRILRDGNPLLTLPAGPGARLNMADFDCGASFHPVSRRDLAGPFCHRPSQDVLHALEVLSLVGGHAPLADTVYELHLSGTSATADQVFAARVHRAYRAHAEDIRQGKTRIRPADWPAACVVLRAKARQNRAFMRQPEAGLFYEFLHRRRMSAAQISDAGKMAG